MILCNAPRFGAVGAHCQLARGHQGLHRAAVEWDDTPPAALSAQPTLDAIAAELAKIDPPSSPRTTGPKPWSEVRRPRKG